MSWAKVFKINNNVEKTLNEHLREIKYNRMKVITSSTSFKPDSSGWYRIICVGAGGDAYMNYATSGTIPYVLSGSGGGVAIKDVELSSSSTYNVTVSTTASFSNILSATGGITGVMDANGTRDQAGGIGSGGDYNYTGHLGKNGNRNQTNYPTKGGSVGVFIPELSRSIVTCSSIGSLLIYGDSILEYGGGGCLTYDYVNSKGTNYNKPGLPAAVIIIPIV